MAGLGPRVLRTETAGPVAVALLQARYGDLGVGRPRWTGSTPSYAYFETDADIGVIGRGADRRRAFVQTALGVFALIVEPGEVEEREQREVRAHGDSLEGLLVAWLNECLYVHDVEGFVARRIEFEVFDDTARAGGERLRLHPSFTGRRSIRLGIDWAPWSRRPRCTRSPPGPPRADSRRGSCWTSSVAKMRQGGGSSVSAIPATPSGFDY